MMMLLAPAPAIAEGRIIGDSLGVGVSWAAKITSTAKNSVSIYKGDVFEQLKLAQRGETVFMSLGTNDAIGGLVDEHVKVAAIAKEADDRGVKLVWMGPPCVRKPWNQFSKKLDENLKAQLDGTDVIYVSMQDPEFCEAKVHAAEGVHFTMAGYTLMWQKAAAVAGFSPVVASASVTKTPAPEGRKPHGRRRHHRKRAAESPKSSARAAN